MPDAMTEETVQREVELRGLTFFAAVDFVSATVVSIECERHQQVSQFPSLTGSDRRYVVLLRGCCHSVLDRVQQALLARISG
ncbi:MAG: hypothetical protein ABI718_02545 [Acidobacteriota bacterium]